MVLTDVPRTVDQLRPEVPRALAAIVAKCLEKVPATRFATVAELAMALEPFAPADTRELAHRIARIASGSKGGTTAPLATSSGTRIAVAGGTSVNWSGKTELMQSSGKRVAVVVSIVGGLAVAAAIVAVLVLRPGRHAPPVTPAVAVPTVETPLPTATLAPTASAPASASGVSETAAPSATASTSAHPAFGHPVGIPFTAPVRPGASAEPPKYRTSW